MASGLNILIYGAKVAADIDWMLKVVDDELEALMMKTSMKISTMTGMMRRWRAFVAAASDGSTLATR